jgi:hypothetical protein
MPAKEWLVPLVLAAVTFAGLAQVDLDAASGPRDASAPTGAGGQDGGFQYAFPQRPVVAGMGHNATVILLSQGPMPTGREGNTDWRTPHVALQTTLPVFVLCTRSVPCGLTHQVADDAAPRLGVAGYNATRVTVHAFDADGVLVASSGNESERARFDRGTGEIGLPDEAWYLGANATAPPGTRALPPAARALLEPLRPPLAGQPVGGVVTVETDAARPWFDTLYVTARIDGLVHAP